MMPFGMLYLELFSELENLTKGKKIRQGISWRTEILHEHDLVVQTQNCNTEVWNF
jgi:hypothetical protein